MTKRLLLTVLVVMFLMTPAVAASQQTNDMDKMAAFNAADKEDIAAAEAVFAAYLKGDVVAFEAALQAYRVAHEKFTTILHTM